MNYSLLAKNRRYTKSGNTAHDTIATCLVAGHIIRLEVGQRPC
jgi:hypothetical protein